MGEQDDDENEADHLNPEPGNHTWTSGIERPVRADVSKNKQRDDNGQRDEGNR